MPGCEIIARGRVQGVGFRWFVQNCANRYGVKGYVQNRPDGSVLIIAVGSQTRLEPFIAEVRQGNRYARVTELTVTDLAQYTEYEDFVIA
jgi:acylphosphatase